jgi:hypothetical protein
MTEVDKILFGKNKNVSGGIPDYTNVRVLPWKSGLGGTAPPQQARSPEFKLQFHKKSTHTRITSVQAHTEKKIGSIYQTFNSSYLQVVGGDLCTLIHFIFRIFGCEPVLTFVKNYFKEPNKRATRSHA